MGTTFLLVEDDPADATLLREALNEGAVDCDIQSVNNGVDASLYVKGEAKFADRTKFPVPQVILLDLNLPLFNGFEFLEWLRTQGPVPHRQIAVVVVSATNRAEDVNRAYDLGANSFIAKSLGWLEFKERIHGMAAYWSQYRRILPRDPPRPGA